MPYVQCLKSYRGERLHSRGFGSRSQEPIDAKWIEAGKWEVEIADKTYPAVASLKPLYDPENKKVKVKL